MFFYFQKYFNFNFPNHLFWNYFLHYYENHSICFLNFLYNLFHFKDLFFHLLFHISFILIFHILFIFNASFIHLPLFVKKHFSLSFIIINFSFINLILFFNNFLLPYHLINNQIINYLFIYRLFIYL